MKNPQKRKPDALAAYRAAGDRLANDGRRLLLIEAIIVSCVMVGVFVMLYQVFSVHGILFPMTRAEILLFYTVYYLLVWVLLISCMKTVKNRQLQNVYALFCLKFGLYLSYI